MKRLKKLVCIVLGCAVVLGTMPLSVFAQGEKAAAITSAQQIGSYYEVDDSNGALPAVAALEGDTQQSYEDGQVKVSKTITGTDEENVFDINLDVVTTDKVEEQEISADAAVVLVIDRSGSMANGPLSERLYYAKKAARTFVNSFADEGAVRKVAIVTFSGWPEYSIDGATTLLGWTDANDVETMTTVINSITAKGGTNMEAGLQLAKNLLASDEVKDIENKNVILLTDGVPTYGLAASADRTSSQVICPSGQNSIGNGTYTTHGIHTQVEKLAGSFDEEINRYAVYVGDDTVKCTNIGCPSSLEAATWLDSYCGFTTYETTDASELTSIFESIYERIEMQARAWMVTDPMGEYIDFQSFQRDSEAVGEFSFDQKSSTITWDLKKATPKYDATTRSYTYNLSYRIRINNLNSGVTAGTYYPTNGVTSLTYLLTTTDANGATSKEGIAYFNIPSVKALSAGLTFTKTDESGNTLQGAEFALTSAEDSTFKLTATSDANGAVTFANIPSGHSYTLKETKAPTGYSKSADKTVSVAWGVTATNLTDNTVVNVSDKISVTVNKVWNDADNRDGKRPESIQVQLYADGVAYGAPVTISAPAVSTPETSDPETEAPETETPEVSTPEVSDSENAEPSDTPEALPETDGTEEENPAVSAPETEDGTLVLLAEADWEADADAVADADVETEEETAAVVNTWTYTWDNLPAYVGGTKVTYTVAEITDDENYVVEYNGAESDANGNLTLTVTNSYTPEVTSWTVTKIWDDDNDRNEKRPESITLQLYADGIAKGDAVTLTKGNNIDENDNTWTYTWENLPAYENGKKIVYTVDETAGGEGYTKTVSGNVITNTYKTTSTETPGSGPAQSPSNPQAPSTPQEPGNTQTPDDVTPSPLPPDEYLPDTGNDGSGSDSGDNAVDEENKGNADQQPLPGDDFLILPEDEKLADSDQPQTGDNSQLLLYLLLALTAAGALTTIAVRRKMDAEE